MAVAVHRALLQREFDPAKRRLRGDRALRRLGESPVDVDRHFGTAERLVEPRTKRSISRAVALADGRSRCQLAVGEDEVAHLDGGPRRLQPGAPCRSSG